MKGLFSILKDWQKEKIPFAIARVVKTWGASPRPIGSTMLIAKDQKIAGSVSGGCVEGAVIKAAMQVIEKQEVVLLKFGVSDEDAWSVGLSCGGKIDVLVTPFNDSQIPERVIWEQLEKNIAKNQGAILIHGLDKNPDQVFLVQEDGTTLGEPSVALRTAALQAFKQRKNQIVEIEGEAFFIHVQPPKDRIFLIGAAHISVDLVSLAHTFGFETIVIDPRGLFVDKMQFDTQPNQLFDQYPSEILPNYSMNEYSFAVVLSHDPKIDDNALHHLLNSNIAYIGALGSKRTHAKRVTRLLEAGYTEEKIGRIHGPIGIDINAKTPKEIALSILSEIIKVRNQHL